jgi:hypothetical protein
LIISADVPMTGSYDYLEVALSVAIAVSASYLSLTLARPVPNRGRITFDNSRYRKLLEARRAEQVISGRPYGNARNRV